jgi:hypothetical protein
MKAEIFATIPQYVSLYRADRGSDLNAYIDCLQMCISNNSLDALHEELDDMISECEHESLACYKQTIQDTIIREYGLAKDQAHFLVFDTYGDEIDEALLERNSSDAIGDLLGNTGKFSCFMDTSLAVESASCGWTEEEQNTWLVKIKGTLKITSPQWDDAIRLMLPQAGYGGRLVVYFHNSVKELLTPDGQDWQTAHFADPAIAIIDVLNGSGDHTHLEGHTFSIPFTRANLFIDRYFKYNYVDEVCGMCPDWCKNSKATFSFDSVSERTGTVSSLGAQALLDRQYAETFKKGSCTLLDMDIRRHRDVYYIHDFPCGRKCPHCGTFRID